MSPSTTRRAVLSGVSAAPLALSPVIAQAAGHDPVVPLGERFLVVSGELREVNAAIMRITHRLYDRGLKPWVRRYGIDFVDDSDVDQRGAELPPGAADRIKAEIAVATAEHNTAFAAEGGPALCDRQAALEDEEDTLVRALVSTPATSPAGVLMKLLLVAAFHPDAMTDPDLPWAHFRSAIADLERMTRADETSTCSVPRHQKHAIL
jgi:hypothetical protein